MKEFEKLYASAYQSGKLLTILFSVSWCGACKTIGPSYNEMVAEYPNVMFSQVDGDKCSDLVEKYKVQAYPTFVFIKQGKLVDSLRGATKDSLRAMIERNMF